MDDRLKISIDQLPEDQADKLGKEISAYVGKEFNQMKDKVKQYLNMYGLDITLVYRLHAKGKEPVLNEGIKENNDKINTEDN